MCVRSGDTLDDNGPVLWCGAALWSQVKSHCTPSPAACPRFDLISIVISLNCTSPVTRTVGASSSPIAICTLVSDIAIHSLPLTSVLPVAHWALTFPEKQTPDFCPVPVQRPCHECLHAECISPPRTKLG